MGVGMSVLPGSTNHNVEQSYVYMFPIAHVYVQVRSALLCCQLPFSNHAVSVVGVRAFIPHMKQSLTTLNNALLQLRSNIGIKYF